MDWERYAKEEKRMCSDHLCGMRRRGRRGGKEVIRETSGSVNGRDF